MTISTSRILTITDAVAARAIDATNYAALEDGAEHTLTAEDILAAGGRWYGTLSEARSDLRVAGGGWTFDDSLNSTWVRTESQERAFAATYPELV